MKKDHPQANTFHILHFNFLHQVQGVLWQMFTVKRTKASCSVPVTTAPPVQRSRVPCLVYQPNSIRFSKQKSCDRRTETFPLKINQPDAMGGGGALEDGGKGKSSWQIDAGFSTHNRSVNRGFNRKTNAASLKYTTITHNPPLQRVNADRKLVHFIPRTTMSSSKGVYSIEGSVSTASINVLPSNLPPRQIISLILLINSFYSLYFFTFFSIRVALWHFLFFSCRTMTFVVQFTDIIQSVQTCSYFTNVQLVEETWKFSRLDS